MAGLTLSRGAPSARASGTAQRPPPGRLATDGGLGPDGAGALAASGGWCSGQKSHIQRLHSCQVYRPPPTTAGLRRPLSVSTGLMKIQEGPSRIPTFLRQRHPLEEECGRAWGLGSAEERTENQRHRATVRDLRSSCRVSSGSGPIPLTCRPCAPHMSPHPAFALPNQWSILRSVLLPSAFLLSQISRCVLESQISGWNRIDTISSLKHACPKLISSQSEISLSDIKGCVMNTLGSLCYTRAAFKLYHVTQGSSHGLDWVPF